MRYPTSLRNAIFNSKIAQKILNRKILPAPLIAKITTPYSQKAFDYYLKNFPTNTTSVYEHSTLFTLAAISSANIVELGTYIGKSTCVLASAVKAGSGRRVITIDLFSREKGDSVSREYFLFKEKSQWDIVHDAIQSLGLQNIIEVYKGSTQDVIHKIPNFGNIDLLFIDAGHFYEDVNKDIELYLPHVNVNGYIIFHDYNNKKWEGVARAVDEFLAVSSIMKAEFLVDSMLVCRKIS